MGIWAFNKSRKQYNEFLSGGQVTSHRYIRLMCLAGFGSVCTISLGAYNLYENGAVLPLFPWVSWANTHADFHRVDQFPAIIWRNSADSIGSSIEFSRWMNVLAAFTFFAFFGFAEEARRYYMTTAQSVTKRLGISSGSFGSTFSSGG